MFVNPETSRRLHLQKNGRGMFLSGGRKKYEMLIKKKPRKISTIGDIAWLLHDFRQAYLGYLILGTSHIFLWNSTPSKTLCTNKKDQIVSFYLGCNTVDKEPWLWYLWWIHKWDVLKGITVSVSNMVLLNINLHWTLFWQC